MHWYLNFILEWNSSCFGQFFCPSSGVFHCTRSNGIRLTCLRAACKWDQDGTMLILLTSCQQTCMTYTIAVCTVKNSLRWTEELSETRGVSFQNRFEKLVHLVGFIIWHLLRCTVAWMSNLGFIMLMEIQLCFAIFYAFTPLEFHTMHITMSFWFSTSYILHTHINLLQISSLL
jgi:hypothetical protein